MAIFVPDASEATLLTFLSGKASPNAQLLKLFVSNTTPGASDTAATYTEMSTHGYAAKTLNLVDWTAATVGGVSTATNVQQTWTFTAAAAVTVYGYFVVDSVSGLLLWSERLAIPRVIQYNGDQIAITPAVTLRGE